MTFCLIANKPAHMDTHPSQPGDNKTLINGVSYHLKQSNQTCIIKHIHRLDKDTTGAVLFAKNRLVGACLIKCWKNERLLEPTMH